MNFITINNDNLSHEHICCAISNEKDPQILSKKSWLSDRFREGLRFYKGDMRGKCFIEYIPAEYAWAPIDANGYLFINCFWIAGQYKGHGYANELLSTCIAEGRENGKHGVAVISSRKKMPFLSDPGYLAYKGFRLADAADPYFTLLYLPFSEEAPIPQFRDCARHPHVDKDGFALYYTHGCPYTAKYVPLLETVAKEHEIPFASILLDSREKAQNAPAVWTNYALFYNGAYITNEIQSDKKFLQLASTMLS